MPPRLLPFSILTAITLTLALSACGGDDSQGSAAPIPPPSPTATPTPTPTPSPTPTPTPTPSPTASPLASWEYILQSQGLPAAPPRVGYLDIDGFDAQAAYVQQAKAQGTQTICYIDVGSAEDFRPDYARFSAIPNLLGRAYPGFSGERYIDIRRYPEFIAVMDDRLRMCRDKGFEYIEFDVIDSFEDGAATTGFALSQSDMVNYVTELSRRARGYGLKTVQKNASKSISLLLPLFDAVLFEECVQGGFCADAAPYVSAGKPALNVEYPANWPAGQFNRATVCSASATAQVSTIIARVDLDRLASDRCP